jgi:uncharacterized protein YeaO (DUF488 family)
MEGNMLKTCSRYTKIPPGEKSLPVYPSGSILGRQLVPDEDALKRFKSGEMDWEFFSYLYKEKLKKLLYIENEAILYVIKMAKSNEVLWINCWESENNLHCHRHLLKQFVEDYCKNKKEDVK